jgi:hypothetical protein
MAKLCNAARTFFRAQPAGTGRNFTQYIVTRRLQSLLCCAALASFRLKSATVVDAKQVLTGPGHLSNLAPWMRRIFHLKFTFIPICGIGVEEMRNHRK